MKKKYKEPNLNISKVYTKVGDKGTTHLIGNEKVPKNDLRVESYGQIDELNVMIGHCFSHLKSFPEMDNYSYISKRLISIQNELFNLGTVLASLGTSSKNDNLPKIDNNDIILLEKDIDDMNSELDPLKSFVLPGGNHLTLYIHSARVMCRKSERSVVSVFNKYPDTDTVVLKYLNRLSDYLFVLGRFISLKLDISENLWDPNNITSKSN